MFVSLIVPGGLRRHLSSSPHPLHQPIPQHPQAYVAKRPIHAQQGPHLRRREAFGVVLESRHDAPSRIRLGLPHSLPEHLPQHICGDVAGHQG
jgi:hypothetical protein